MKDLDMWLEETAYDKPYWSDVKIVADALMSDGCTGAPDWLKWTCWEHDALYRRHCMIHGGKIDRATADYIFRRRIQQGSGFGRLSPVSWWRWAGVRLLGSKAWSDNKLTE